MSNLQAIALNCNPSQSNVASPDKMLPAT